MDKHWCRCLTVVTEHGKKIENDKKNREKINIAVNMCSYEVVICNDQSAMLTVGETFVEHNELKLWWD